MLSSRRGSSIVPSRNSRNILLVSQTPPPALSRTSSTGANTSSPATARVGNAVQISNARSRFSRSISYDSQADGPPRMYLLGTRIECRLPIWSRFYSGKIAAVNNDGTLMVAFDDGDLRDCVQLSNVVFETRITPSSGPLRVRLMPGSQVEVSQDQQRAFPARVTDILSGDRYSLTLCDGRVIQASRDQIRCYIPSLGGLTANEEIEVLIHETRTWVPGRIDETVSNVAYTDEKSGTQHELPLSEVDIRYPIVNPPRQTEDEDSLDATPMILSMQERLSQSIEVGAHVLITDKNGGALPKTGKADSAQVSIINFPLPADGIIESVTLRLFEPPAEESTQFDVVLFEREQIPTGPTRTHRLSSVESSGDESGNSPQLGPAGSPVDLQVARFFVAPDLPYRPSRSPVVIDPHSRGVQTMKLLVPLRGSAGQYLGIMNRRGRLNIAYTPDKKKPGESWSEKSVEVFYMMPRMVPKPFAGGPHTTRDWHGRAGWFASMIVSDPVDAVDPGWQRRCALDALARRDGATETRRICWLVTTLVNEGRADANSVLFDSPQFVRALRRLSEVDDSVIELITNLCMAALASPTKKTVGSSKLQPFIRMQRALNYKAYEMQVVQRGRLTTNVASLQSILKCLLMMKRLLRIVAMPVRNSPSSFAAKVTRKSLSPRPAGLPAQILYYCKKDGTVVVSRSEFPSLRPGVDELVPSQLPRDKTEDAADFAKHWQMCGPVTKPENFYPEYPSLNFERWQKWTQPVELVFKTSLEALGCLQQQYDGIDVEDVFQKRSVFAEPESKDRDWLDDLERATTLLSAFAKQQLPPLGFVREQLLLWKQKKSKVKLESPHPIPLLSTETDDPSTQWTVSIPGASRLKLEWAPQSRLQDGQGTAIAVSFGDGLSYTGRNGLPPPVERVEGDSVTIKLSRCRSFDPGEIVRKTREMERATLPKAKGLVNPSGDAVRVQILHGGEARYACSTCIANLTTTGSSSLGACCESLRLPENNHGRFVSPVPSRGTWGCSECISSQAPCRACISFASSLAVMQSRVRHWSTFHLMTHYEDYLFRALVPGVPVYVTRKLENEYDELRKFSRLSTEGIHTVKFDQPLDSPAGETVDGPSCISLVPENAGPGPFIRSQAARSSVPPQASVPQEMSQGSNPMTSSTTTSSSLPPSTSTFVPSRPSTSSPAPPQSPQSHLLRHYPLSNGIGALGAELPGWLGSNRNGGTNAHSSAGGTFASNDLGPDIAISNNGMTVTRLRSLGWGTQRMSRYLDVSCGVTTITFRIDRNTSNHLFFGVVAPSFDDWSRRMMEPGAWSIRRDGSTHADGRERTSATPDARLVTGESLTMIVDMISEPRSVTFMRESVLLGKIQGLPPRVVPAVSFGGSNQIVTIVSFVTGGLSGVGAGNGGMGSSLLGGATAGGRGVPGALGGLPAAGSSLLGEIIDGGSDRNGRRFQQEWGFALNVVPEYTKLDPEEEAAYIASCASNWTFRQDRTLVMHIDEIAMEKKFSLAEVLIAPWEEFVRSNGSSSSSSNQRRSTNPLLEALQQEDKSMESVAQRFQWIRALNASVAKALPLLDLAFDNEGGTVDTSIVSDLSECSHLILDVVKKPMWEDALECTRTEEGQFEVMLDYGRALAHRQFMDLHGRFSIFGQAFRAINPMPPSKLRMRGQLYRATLRGMRAHDDGGPYRQSFQTYCAELLSTPGVGLFLPCANRANEIHVNRDRWLPNPGAKSALQISMFEFVGKLMGIALRNNEFLDLRLPSLVWKWLVNRRPTFEDLRAVDLLFANTIQEIQEAPKDDQEVWGEEFGGGVTMNFTIYSLDGRVCELVPGGEQRLVAFAQDRQEWAQLATRFKLNEFNEQLEAIRRGLATVVPQRMLVLFTWDELELMVCGRPRIDLQLLREMTVYVGCTESDSHIQAFWRVLHSFSEEVRSLYLRFVWGRSRLPASRQTWGDTPHKISSFEVPPRNAQLLDVDSLLPRSHTCYFSLDLPRYSSEDVLRKKLLFAIENCTEIDADQTTTGNRSAALGFDLDVDLTDVDEHTSGGASPALSTATTAVANPYGPTALTASAPEAGVSGAIPTVSSYHRDVGERRASQSSFGSDFDVDEDDDVFEAESEILARLGHDFDALSVFPSDGIIDFGRDDDDDDDG